MDCIGVGSAVAWLGTNVTNCLGEFSRLGESDSTFGAGALPMSRGDGMARRPRRISLDIVVT